MKLFYFIHMIHLIDTFNNRLISKHRTAKAAVGAKHAHLRAVKKANGQNSYLTYGFEYHTGEKVNTSVIHYAEHQLHSGY